MSASAGRVLLIPKGAYNASATYAPLDYVTYTDGNTYVCKAATTGHAPTDTTYWQILVDNSGVAHTVDIAIIESGTTASANRAVGDFVYVSGTLYRVTAAISAGAAYTVGTNIKATTIGGELANLTCVLSGTVPTAGNSKSIDLPTGTSQSNWLITSYSVSKWGRWYDQATVKVSFGITISTSSNNNVEISNEYNSTKHPYDAAGDPIKILLIRV